METVGRGRRRGGWLALGALLLGGCLEPLVSDAVELESVIFPAGADIPSLHTDVATAEQIDAGDGVGALVPRTSAFADGERIFYWDFGLAPPVAIPILVLAGEDAEGDLAPLGVQPNIIDAIPGDPEYSPFWSVVLVPVTDAWDGEVFASFEAVAQGQAEGLLAEPVPLPSWVNCPVVHPDVRLMVGGGEEPMAPSHYYYRGQEGTYFTFGGLEPLPDPEDLTMPIEDVYLLRREGGELLSEPHRGVDMTGDGDANDSNQIFEVGLGEGYTPLWSAVEVVVPPAYASIDTSGDETVADYTSVEDLFDAQGVARADHIVAYSSMGMLVNCPIQGEEGGP